LGPVSSTPTAAPFAAAVADADTAAAGLNSISKAPSKGWNRRRGAWRSGRGPHWGLLQKCHL